MKSVINWSAENCSNCIKCVRKCPVDAVSIVNHQVKIDDSQCINCAVCIRACSSRILKVETSKIDETLKEHAYNVVLVPTSILSEPESFDEYQKICLAIKKMGFDEVVQYSDIEGYLYEKAIEESKKRKEICFTSFCPTVNRLIRTKYPTLLDHLLPYNYPVEVAAKRIREKYKGKDVGIHSLCECVGKMTLAKHPYNNEKSVIDYAISISSVFPAINRLKSEDKLDIHVNRKGVESILSQHFAKDDLSVLSIDGLTQCAGVLDLIEFDNVNHAKLGALFTCYKGCIGGYFLWANPYEGSYHIESMMDDYDAPDIELDEDEYIIDREIQMSGFASMKDRLTWFNKVNIILEQLPQFDCGACGFPNCRSLAQSIAKGENTVATCRVRRDD